MRDFKRCSTAWIPLWALLACIGCGQSSSTVGVSGVVTFDGQPIEAGRITLEPVDDKRGQRRDITIAGGNFALSPEQGVLPGEEFKVTIQAFRKTGKKFPSPDPTKSYDEEVQYLPAKYNSASTLRVKISPDELERQLQFDLTSR